MILIKKMCYHRCYIEKTLSKKFLTENNINPDNEVLLIFYYILLYNKRL